MGHPIDLMGHLIPINSPLADTSLVCVGCLSCQCLAFVAYCTPPDTSRDLHHAICFLLCFEVP